MKKKWLNVGGHSSPLFKWLRIMKLTLFILMIAFVHVSASVYSQQTQLSVSVKNASVKEVLRDIEDQSEFFFLYKNEEVDVTRKVDINIKDKSLEELLNLVFMGTEVSYEIHDRQIVLRSNSYQTQKKIKVSGKVTNVRQEPVPGATVAIQGTAQGTITDSEGNYALNDLMGDAMLVFSFIGMKTQEIAVNGRPIINVTLDEDVKGLEEIVVVGYGTQKRENVIGSIAQMSTDKIASRSVSELKNVLTGQLAGVIVTQRGGRPGVSSGTISVRGVGSFGAAPNALILVDGTPVDNFNDIDPNDVETISVLKDASSAAIYGSRAANGVILVTTKSGKEGKPQISLSSYVASQVPTAMPEYVNSWEYQQAYYEAENGTSQLTQAQMDEVEKYRAQNDPNYPNTNFLDAIISKNGMQTGHNINISGGTNTNKYNLSFGYLYQDGMVIKNDYSRYNVRLNMVTTFSPKFSLTTRLAAISSKVNEPIAPAGGSSGNMLNMIEQAARLPNIFVSQYDNGDFGVGLSSNGTPVSDLASKSFYWGKQLNLTGNIRLDYKVIKDLKLSFIAGYRQNISRDKTFRSTQRLNNDITVGPNFLREETGNNEYYTIQGLADYSKQFNKHFISFLAGYSFENYTAENFEAYRDNLPSNDLTVLQTGSPDNQQSDGTGAEYALESQFARANYNFAGKYLIEGVVRRDGSSRFPTSQKYAVFPSLAAGWSIGKEKFIKDNISWINELKIKASWGVLGNQNISNYPYQNTLISSTGTTYSFGGGISPGAARTTLVDSTLHWESTRTKDIGVDISVFENKLNISATYFDRYTYDILYSPATSVSNVLGFGLSQQNTGELQNRGWEFTANHSNTLGEFSYNISANFTIVNNKVLDLGVGNINQPNGMVGNGSDLFIGYPNSNGSYALYYGYVADGLYVDAQDVIDYETTNDQQSINPNPKPGDIRYKDISGPEGVPDGIVNATYDRVVLGSQIPKYSYGVNLGVKYKGFDLSILLQGIAGVKGRLQSYASWALNQNTGNIQRWQYEGRWTEQNPDRNAIYPRIEKVPGGGVPNTLLSSYWILDGSYLRVKNLQIGYNISKQALKNIGISNARLYMSGENLHTFSKYEKGWDPEVNGTGEFYPIMSTYTLGIDITF